MVNDELITNPNNYYDDLCNQIISYSSEVSKELNVTYGELWVWVMIIIFILIIWYNILLLVSLHSSNKKVIKWLFWISNLALLIFTFFTVGDFMVYCKYYL